MARHTSAQLETVRRGVKRRGSGQGYPARCVLDGGGLNPSKPPPRPDLTVVYLLNADLSRTFFEPKFLPELRGVARAKNLELLTYGENPDALVQLRKQFADGGFRDQERKITYALKRKEAGIAWEECKFMKTGDKTRAILWSSDSNLANCGSFVLSRVFFDWTCQYGMSPGRPLSLGVLVWAFCSILYFVSVTASREAGLYRVYAQSIHDNHQVRSVRKKFHLPLSLKLAVFDGSSSSSRANGLCYALRCFSAS